MRKILATAVLSGLALVPATSAWAGGAGGSSKDVRDVASASSDPVTGSKQLFAYGCHQGSVFGMYITDSGTIRGQIFPMLACVGESFYYAQ